MSNVYLLLDDEKFELNLEESGCAFQIALSEKRGDGFGYIDSDKLNEDQIIEIAARLLGPMFYFSDTPDEIIPKFLTRLLKLGFCYPKNYGD